MRNFTPAVVPVTSIMKANASKDDAPCRCCGTTEGRFTEDADGVLCVACLGQHEEFWRQEG